MPQKLTVGLTSIGGYFYYTLVHRILFLTDQYLYYLFRMSFSLSLSNFLSVITSNCGNVSGLLFSGSLDNIHINLNYQTQLWDIYRRMKNMVCK